MKRGLITMAVLAAMQVAFLLAAAGSARAQVNIDSSLAAPFPEVEIYRVQVYGDSLGEGLHGGLLEAFAGDARIQLQRRNRSIAGLLRGDAEEDAKAIESEIASNTPHIAIIMLGVGDRVPLRGPSGRRVIVGSEEWRAEYGRRVDRLMKVFRKKAVAVYWVSLPNMRRQDLTDDALMMGGVMRERALVNSARFIDILKSFAETDGSYTNFGPDISGKNRLLREQDGVHFTSAGYRRLAHFVEREMRRDMAQARAERALPLAGNEEEQRRIRPLKVSASPQTPGAVPAAPATKGTPVLPGAGRASVPGERPTTPGAPDQGREGDLLADNSRVTLPASDARAKEEPQTIEIIRPAVPASVVALVTRRESAERASQIGDPLMTEILDGVTMVNTVTPTGETGPGDRRRQSPTNSLYYRVLVKGERAEVKPGRSDDMPWPRQEVLPPAPPKAEPATVPPAATQQPRPQRGGRPVPRG